MVKEIEHHCSDFNVVAAQMTMKHRSGRVRTKYCSEREI
jgi:hypothetical protein